MIMNKFIHQQTSFLFLKGSQHFICYTVPGSIKIHNTFVFRRKSFEILEKKTNN